MTLCLSVDQQILDINEIRKATAWTKWKNSDACFTLQTHEQLKPLVDVKETDSLVCYNLTCLRADNITNKTCKETDCIILNTSGVSMCANNNHCFYRVHLSPVQQTLPPSCIFVWPSKVRMRQRTIIPVSRLSLQSQTEGSSKDPPVQHAR